MRKPSLRPEERIIIALDVSSLQDALSTVDQLSKFVRHFKVGSELFSRCGPDGVAAIAGRRHIEVFLDLKLHDIPNTVAAACRNVARLPVSMTTAHAAGGVEMLRAGAQALAQSSKEVERPQPRLLAVTVLTSLDDAILSNDLQWGQSVEHIVVRLAHLAKTAGCDGVIASPRELPALSTLAQDMLVVTPGVRPSWAARGDQRRTMTPGDAIRSGADYVVVGRPVTAPPEDIDGPEDALNRIIGEIEAAGLEAVR